MKALFELFRRFDARRIFGFIRRLGACHVQKSSVTICVLPAPSGWRATRFKMLGDHAPIIISIHALRVEGDDGSDAQEIALQLVFLSTPSGWRATYSMSKTKSVELLFLSTPSGWRATCAFSGATKCSGLFLSTPSGWRATAVTMLYALADQIFLSTPSGWRATHQTGRLEGGVVISIHALRVEGDCNELRVCSQEFISIHALRVEGDRKKLVRLLP